MRKLLLVFMVLVLTGCSNTLVKSIHLENGDYFEVHYDSNWDKKVIANLSDEWVADYGTTKVIVSNDRNYLIMYKNELYQFEVLEEIIGPEEFILLDDIITYEIDRDILTHRVNFDKYGIISMYKDVYNDEVRVDLGHEIIIETELGIVVVTPPYDSYAVLNDEIVSTHDLLDLLRFEQLELLGFKVERLYN